jgi:hypothetical protein
MILFLSFLVPDAIVSTPIGLEYIETMERIDAVSTRAIAGHTTRGKTPRIAGMRSWLLELLLSVKYASSSTGK